MALIKCPECGNDVSTSADACPHCGFPMKNKQPDEPKEYAKPLDDSWMETWKGKPGRSKIALTIVYFINLLFILLFVLLGLGIGAGFPAWAYVGIMVFAFISIFTFSFWIAGFICLKYKVINCDGYNAIAIAGVWSNYLVIENKIFEKAHNRHLDGNLPNGKHVKADFAFWDSSIRLSIDDISYRTSK